MAAVGVRRRAGHSAGQRSARPVMVADDDGARELLLLLLAAGHGTKHRSEYACVRLF